ncbi:aminopeptidase P family protein [Wolbachia endosymbiont of Pentidionis agamae]|uniref:aminopeptidase P family protein n=1 Tax=Wolbachia endosymbiont of Pentidionis agamae TaxID=3110435 RepID=UPI002FD1C677
MLNLEEFRLSMNVDAFIINVERDKETTQKLCGFTGTNGVLIVMKEGKCQFFTDGRYLLQANNQLNKDLFDIYNIHKKNPWEWVSKVLSYDTTLGYNSSKFTINNIRKYEDICKLVPHFIKIMDQELNIVQHPIEYCGENSEEKCTRIAKTLDEPLLITCQESVSWLLNIRDENAKYTPSVSCPVILYKDCTVDLFVQKDFFLPEKHVNTLGVEELHSALNKLGAIILDPNFTLMNIKNLIESARIIEKDDPCIINKAIKNKIEIRGMKSAHIRDGIAVTNFLYWLENNKGITELDAEEKILEYRKRQNLFKQPSFRTISAFNENGAIIHYGADQSTNKVIKEHGLYLIDSGGQYLDGTTDVTRTVAIGTPSHEQITYYTLVLKAHIAIASSVFPSNTTGGELDILARIHLWKYGIDYMHSTGHGVGSYLSVHEGPQGIVKGNNIRLVPNMILSNEPGYYIENKYGMRIENLMYINTRSDGFLYFKPLTCVPLDKKLINKNMLIEEEINWINNYHKFVYENLVDHVVDKKWLKEICKI